MAPEFEQKSLAAVRCYEPRILRNSAAVHMKPVSSEAGCHSMVFEIAGELWAKPLPEAALFENGIGPRDRDSASSRTNPVDKRFLLYYNRELQHLRETAGEFASEFPKIAGRLGLDAFDCADPYVERLLEGFAFLAARVQLKIDAEFPRFTQHLFETVFPHYLAPLPSMAVVQFEPDLSEPDLGRGICHS